jgi:hypothetical protein
MRTLLAALAALLLAAPVFAQDNSAADESAATADSWARPAAPAKTAAKAAPAAPAKIAALPAPQNTVVAAGPDDLGEQPINAVPFYPSVQAQDADASDPDDRGYRGPTFAFPLVIAGLGFLALTGMALYFLPTIVALARRKRNSGAIFALNLLLGWSFIGWVAALVWAVMTDSA